MRFRSIDWAPLSAKISKEERNLHKDKYLLQTSILLQFWLVFGVLMIATGIILFLTAEYMKDGLIAGGLGIIGSLPLWWGLRRWRKSWTASAQLQKFAQANRFKYEKNPRIT